MFEKSLLERMQPAILGQSLDGHHLALPDAADIHLAGACGLAIEQDGASAAMPFPAAIFRAGQMQIIAQDAQERAFPFGVNLGFVPINKEFGNSGHRQKPFHASPPFSHTPQSNASVISVTQWWGGAARRAATLQFWICRARSVVAEVSPKTLAIIPGTALP
jgi:hypothetical protein